MIMRRLAFEKDGIYYLSQEFNGDAEEAKQFNLQTIPDDARWEYVPQLFIEIGSLSEFKEQVEFVEHLYGYESLELTESSELPLTDEIWCIEEGNIQLALYIPYQGKMLPKEMVNPLNNDSSNLYRGKRKDNKEWVYGFYYKDIWGDDSEYITYDCENYEIIPHTVGKCTGFPDCYQGDILQCPSGDEIGVVRYGEYNDFIGLSNTDHIGFYVEWISGRDKDLLRNDLGYWIKYALIIGNVVDNPELLPESANQTE